MQRLNLACFLVLALSFAARASAKDWSYDVLYESKGRVLKISGDLPPGAPLTSFGPSKEYFKDVVKSPNGRVTYSFLLGEAAERMKDQDDIRAAGSIIMSNPGVWLLRPEQLPEKQRVTLRLRTDGEGRFATGLFPVKSSPETYETTADHLIDMPWTIVGPYHARSFESGGASVDVAIVPAAYKATETQIVDWVKRATSAVSAFYGKFPVPHILVVVVSREYYEGPGKSFGDGGAVTLNPLALKAGDEDLRQDWVMTHEMVHLAFPSVAYPHHWIEEGLATYIEPLARIRTGELKAEDVFHDMIEGMPKGNQGRGGLDGTRDWGRTYWGGALFALLADKEIRVETKGKYGLDDALRAIVEAGGTMNVRWRLEDALAIGDKATGTHVLMNQYTRLKDAWAPVDLEALWKSLGVIQKSDGTVSFDDRAPLAFVRKGMARRL